MSNLWEKYLIIVYIIQLIIAFIIVLYSVIRRRSIPLEKIAILVLLPVFGLFIPYLGRIFPSEQKEGDLDDVFDHGVEDIRDDIRYEKMLEFEKEFNYVPLDEALILNNSSVKKELILDIAKADAMGHLEFLKLAMTDRDMETSHYAASIVMEVNRGFQEAIQNAVTKYSAEPENIDNLIRYVEVIGKYYHSGLLDENNERRYATQYSKLLDELLGRGYYTEKFFQEKINLDIEINELARIFDWIAFYKEKYPESDSPYLLMMKYYYFTKNIEGIKKVLEALENSHVNTTPKGEDMIKYWKSIV